MRRAPSVRDYARMTERVKVAAAALAAEHEAAITERRELIARDRHARRDEARRRRVSRVGHLDRDWAAEAARMLPDIVARYDDDEETIAYRRWVAGRSTP